MRPCSNVVAVRGKSDIEQLRAKLMAGTLTSRELVERYLARIDELDRTGPRLNSIMEINPDALAIAEQIRAAVLAVPPVVEGTPMPVRLSGGVAGYPEHAVGMRELLLAAERALRQAKETGRDRVLVSS